MIILFVFFWDWRLFNAKNLLENFLIKFVPSVEVLIETFLKDFKTVSAEETEYEYQNMLNLIALFRVCSL